MADPSTQSPTGLSRSVPGAMDGPNSGPNSGAVPVPGRAGVNTMCPYSAAPGGRICGQKTMFCAALAHMLPKHDSKPFSEANFAGSCWPRPKRGRRSGASRCICWVGRPPDRRAHQLPADQCRPATPGWYRSQHRPIPNSGSCSNLRLIARYQTAPSVSVTRRKPRCAGGRPEAQPPFAGSRTR